MGRSISYPKGAVAGFCELDNFGEERLDWACECLVDDVVDKARGAFFSLETFDG